MVLGFGKDVLREPSLNCSPSLNGVCGLPCTRGALNGVCDLPCHRQQRDLASGPTLHRVRVRVRPRVKARGKGWARGRAKVRAKVGMRTRVRGWGGGCSIGFRARVRGLGALAV